MAGCVQHAAFCEFCEIKVNNEITIDAIGLWARIVMFACMTK